MQCQIIIRFVLFFFVLSPFLESAEKSCTHKVLTELYKGKVIVVTDYENVKIRSGKVRRKHLFGHSNDLVIAFDDKAHAYDNIFNIRHDGHHSQPGRVKVGTDVMEFGNYLRFEGLTTNQKNKLYAHLKSLKGKELQQRSCIESTCKMIDEGAGIKLKGGLPTIPSQIFKKIMTKGFVDENGKPVEYSIYRLHGKSIQETYDILKGREKDYLKRKIKEFKKKVTLKSVYYIVSRGIVVDVVLETSGSSPMESER